MGNASGKLVLNPITQEERKTEKSPTTESAQLETTAQLVNGEATVCPDVPPIDEGIETEMVHPVQCEPPTETQQKDGDSKATPAGKSKKSKNPIMWLQRRLSKNVTPKKGSNTTTESEDKEPQQDNDETKLSGVAEDLVEEVISSALTTGDHPTEETKATEAEQPAIEVVLKPEPVETEIAEQSESCNPIMENGDAQPVAHEESTAEVIDTNNTNAHDEDTFNSEIPTTKLLHHDPVEKAPELELTNGHTENGSECNGHTLNGSLEA